MNRVISIKFFFLSLLVVMTSMTVTSCHKKEASPSLFNTIYHSGTTYMGRIDDAEFLLKYNALLDDNIESFFDQWRSWSDSIAGGSNYAPLDSLFRLAFSLYPTERDAFENITLPSTILVELFPMKLSDIDVKLYDFPKEYQKKVIKRLYYTPRTGDWLDRPVLYMTPKIENLLSEFLGSITAYDADGNKYLTTKNEEHVQYLNSKIAVEYGPWGGYWFLTSMPTISEIFIFTDGQVVSMTINSTYSESVFFPNDKKKKPEIIDSLIQ